MQQELAAGDTTERQKVAWIIRRPWLLSIAKQGSTWIQETGAFMWVYNWQERFCFLLNRHSSATGFPLINWSLKPAITPTSIIDKLIDSLLTLDLMRKDCRLKILHCIVNLMIIWLQMEYILEVLKLRKILPPILWGGSILGCRTKLAWCWWNDLKICSVL